VHCCGKAACRIKPRFNPPGGTRPLAQAFSKKHRFLMIQTFRKFFGSKIGIGVTLAFLALIAVAFASSDVANTTMFGGVSGGDRVAVVGDERIDAAELSMNASNAIDNLRQTDPTITMQAFIAQGGLEDVLDQMLQRTALAEFARRHGMRASDRLVDSELLQIPAFRGPDGNFNQDSFRAALSQRGFTESAIRADLAQGLLVRQLVTPITFSPVMPASFGRQYATLLRERREGAIALLPSTAFAPQGNPTAEALQAFYRENTASYIRPERRVIRFASFGEEALGTLRAPTEAEIAARFERDRTQYAASERRTFTQLVLPTQDAAQAVLAEVRGGKSLDVAAREKGLATASVGPVTRAQLTTNASAAVTQAAFAAAQGGLSQPARGGLGWYVLRVDAVDRQPARTLAQVRGDISAALAGEQRRAALSDLTARLEEELDSGGSLTDVAEELEIEVTTTAPATADGRLYGREGETVPPLLGRALETAFAMEESQPQLAEIVPGETFLIFDVAEVTPSAAAPLAEIRPRVIQDWRRDQGARAARAAADRIIARLGRGTSLAEAISAEERTLPAPQSLALGREELGQLGDVPANLALFFSMAAGTVKKLEAPQDGGWYIVQLDEIEPGEVAANDPIVIATLRQLGTVTGEEYIQQFVKAAEREVGVERNQAAIDAVAAQLTGQQVN
jgi:peptidyl-prolyl cis-trans isomerase D